MNISHITDCYGCGVCATACSKKIINIRLNESGFYKPYIDNLAQCSDCGLCVEVCSYTQKGLSLKEHSIRSYAGWSKDSAVRKKCSSGGVGFELGRTFINKGYKVCGVRYNIEKNHAEHYIATTIEELISSIGSKYIQSYTVDGFNSINKKERYLVIGTPCQIDSFRRYIQRFNVEDNFTLVDFFCHGVPSKLVWDKYLKEVEKKIGRVTYVSWRNKFTGWHDSWSMSIDGEKTGEKENRHDSYNSLIKEKKGIYNSRFSKGDIFYRLFLSDACLGKACYEKCKFKYNQSSADIRIGDLWGKMYKDNEEGVSSVISFSEKGKQLLRDCNCVLIEHSFEDVAEGQMKTSPQKSQLYFKLSDALKKDCDILYLANILKRFNRREKWTNLLLNPQLVIKKIMKL